MPVYRQVTKAGKQYLEPCSAGSPGAFETDLNKLAEQGKASEVAPPSITMSMMRRVLGKGTTNSQPKRPRIVYEIHIRVWYRGLAFCVFIAEY